MPLLRFTKMNGAGNDFVIIDNRRSVVPEPIDECVRTLTDRIHSIGADGLILIEKASDADFTMRYFNADGSFGALCGNGARCAVRFAQSAGVFEGSRTTFRVLDQTFKADAMADGRVRIHMPEPKRFMFNLILNVGSMKLRTHYVDVGSQHAVIFLEDTPIHDLDHVPIESCGPMVRAHEMLGPQGANANFVEITGVDSIRLRTFERGVEAETLACGTGAVSSAMVAHSMHEVKTPVRVQTKRGDELIVDFDVVEGHVKKLSLTGPTEVMFSGEIEYPR